MNEPKIDDLKIIAFNSYDDFSKYSAQKIVVLYKEIESLKAITELKNVEIAELREREYNHYPIVIMELESRIFKLEDEISKLNTAAVLAD